MDDQPVERSSLGDLLLYFLRLGTLGFGGPIALAEYMERDLVQKHRWISHTDYVQGLALAELAPGPMATQLAIYLGYVHSGILGATLVGLVFVLPSFLMVLAISSAYVHFGGLRWMQALFYGIGAAVIGIIARSAYKLTKRTVGRKPLLWAIYALLAITTAVTRREILTLIVLAGLVTWWLEAGPRWQGSSLAVVPWLALWSPTGSAGPDASLLWRILGFFAKAGTFVFGSGLAIVPFLYGGVVQQNHWLTARQFVDAVAVAMITPGPVVITVAFIGYLVAGFAGACLAALGVFLPVYFFVIIPAPWYRKHGARPGVIAFVTGVTAAAIGAITGAVYVVGRGAIHDLPTALIAVGSLALLIYAKIPEPALVVLAGIVGLFLFRG